MKKNNIILLMFVALFAVTSCSESLLDVTPIGDTSDSEYMKTPAEAEAALIGIYDAIQSAYNGNSWNSPFLVYNILGDGMNAGGGGPTDQSQLQAFGSFSHGVDNPAVASVFKDYYTFISSANNILVRIPSEFSNSTQIKAECLFFRAFSYFHLVRAWGSVPFYTENPDPLASSVPKADVATIYAQIEKDLTDAIDMLPIKSKLDVAQYRVSKGTAQSLLGKVYLYQKKYALSHQMFDAVISSEEYDLTEDFTTIWDKENRAGDESIFEILYTSSNQVDWGGPWDGTAESNFIVQLSGPRDAVFANLKDVNAFFEAKKEENDAAYQYKISDLNYGWGFCIPTEKIGDHIYANAGDMRKCGSLISIADYTAAGGALKDDFDPDKYPAYEGYMRVKWATRKSHTSSGGVTDLNYQTPFKLIRYADVLLMAAEAYVKDGKDAEAIEELKKVRERAGFSDFSDFESLTGDALFEYIVEERVNELSFEGHRFFDLVRWDKAATELADFGFQSNKHELLPIPQSEFNKNSALDASTDQNPGY